MAFIPTPAIALANIFYQDANNVVAVNRLYCAAETVPTELDLEEIADALYDVWVAQIMTNVYSLWNLTGITVRAMNEAEGLQFVSPGPFPIAGSVSEAVVPANQVSYTTTLSTGLVGRSARGRVYGVGLPNSFHNGTRLLDASQGFLQSSWELVQTAMETAGHSLQVVSFFEGGVPRTEGRPLPVTAVNVRFPLATQRRRLA